MSAGAPLITPLKDVLVSWDSVIERWDLKGFERSRLLGGGFDGPVTDVETYRLLCAEQRMRLVVELDPVLHRVYGDVDRIRCWLRLESENLGGRTPLEVMARSPEWIRWLIDNLGLAA